VDGTHFSGAPVIDVDARSDATIDVVAVAAAVSASLSLASIAVAAAGANASNVIGSSAAARLDKAHIHGDGDNNVSVEAAMSGDIESTVVVASISVGSFGVALAIGASLSDNTITADAGAQASMTDTRATNLGA